MALRRFSEMKKRRLPPCVVDSALDLCGSTGWPMALAKTIVFTSGNRTLQGVIFGPSDGDLPGLLLFVHGLGSSQAGYAHRASAVSDSLAIRCLTFDLSGHGLSRASCERYSVYDHLEDVIAGYDYLMTTSTAGTERVGVCGASYGAYLAALLSGRRRVERLLLRAPAVAQDVDFPDERQTPVPAYASGRVDAFDSLAALSRFTRPVIILESELDERIPPSQILLHLDACPQAKHEVIAGATHALTDPTWNSIFVDAIIRWFGDLEGASCLRSP